MVTWHSYWNPHDVAFRVGCASDENATQQHTNSAQQGAYAQEELDPSHNLDVQLDPLVHGLEARVAVWQDQIAIWVLVEVNERSVLLLLGRCGWHSAGHGDRFRVEGRVVDGRIVQIWLEPANHDDERRVVMEQESVASATQPSSLKGVYRGTFA